MPRLSVYFIRASMIHALLGFTVGGLLLANKGIMFLPAVWSLLPLHIEFAFIGWMVQLSMGVAFWILPRLSHGSPRGNEKFIWAAFALLNTGILFVVIQNFSGANGFAFLGRIMELLALAAFAAGNWKRIKPLEDKSRS